MDDLTDAKGREGGYEGFTFAGIPIYSCPKMTKTTILFVTDDGGPNCPYCGEERHER